MKQTRIHCPYCGSLATLRPASAIHGLSDISAGTYLYVCRRWPACDAYVTADRRTKQPLGTLAKSMKSMYRSLCSGLSSTGASCEKKKSAATMKRWRAIPTSPSTAAGRTACSACWFAGLLLQAPGIPSMMRCTICLPAASLFLSARRGRCGCCRSSN